MPKSPKSYRTFLLVFWVIVPLGTSAAELPVSRDLFLQKYCVACHDADAKEGDLDLEVLGYDLQDLSSFQKWQRVFDRVQDGEMPPKDESRPAVKDSEAFLSELRHELHTADAARIAQQGRVHSRRLTRFEYERTVQDLLGINVPLQVLLPEDPRMDGFDTVVKAQQVSEHLLAKYLEAADVALDAAMDRVSSPQEPWYQFLDWKQLRRNEDKPGREPAGRATNGDVVAWSTNQAFYGRIPATTVPESGWYRIRMKANAVNPPTDGRIWCSVRSGVCQAKASTLYWIGSLEATERLDEFEFQGWIQAGHKLEVRPNDSSLKVVAGNSGRGSANGPCDYLEATGHPGLAIQSIEMERIFPGGSETYIRKLLYGDLALEPAVENSVRLLRVVPANPESDLAALIYAFASRAFRRPVTAQDVRPYVELAQAQLASGATFEKSLRAAYRGILCSPRLIYLEEAPEKLDDHAVAARLSYFIWSSLPDEELRKWADAGRLREPTILHAQIARLLDDDKASAFIKNFTGQWLNLSEIDFTTPDAKLYPEYDEVLKSAMLEETQNFFRELLIKDLSVTNVVDSDFTMLNSRLARHYGIPWERGTGLKRVPLDPEYHRGGLITHASVLKVTANGTTTSPVIRGVWMLERIMGSHVPPPPANVPAVEPDIRGATTIRQQLDKHRNIDACAACHVDIDPPGFALENYDVVGGWRSHYRAMTDGGKKGKAESWQDGLRVDSNYVLADGTSFADIEEFKQLLLRDPEQLARNLAQHFVTYATGASPSFADRQSIDRIVASSAESNYGVRTLVHQVICSELFLNK